MPIVKIEYEKTRVSEEEMQTVATALHGFVAEVTGYEPKDISVFASPNHFSVNAAPLEVYIYGNFPDATESSMEATLEKLAALIAPFKIERGITTPLNLSIAKMNWKFKLEV